MKSDAWGLSPDNELPLSCRRRLVLLQDFREQTALRLFQQGRVSSGYAARLIGISRLEFLRLLEQRGPQFAEHTRQDFQDDARTMREIRGGGENTSDDRQL